MSEKIIEILNSYVAANGNEISQETRYTALWKHGKLIDTKSKESFFGKIMVLFYHEIDGIIIQHGLYRPKDIEFGYLKIQAISDFDVNYLEVERIPVTTYEYKPVEG